MGVIYSPPPQPHDHRRDDEADDNAEKKSSLLIEIHFTNMLLYCQMMMIMVQTASRGCYLIVRELSQGTIQAGRLSNLSLDSRNNNNNNKALFVLLAAAATLLQTL